MRKIIVFLFIIGAGFALTPKVLAQDQHQDRHYAPVSVVEEVHRMRERSFIKRAGIYFGAQLVNGMPYEEVSNFMLHVVEFDREEEKFLNGIERGYSYKAVRKIRDIRARLRDERDRYEQ